VIVIVRVGGRLVVAVAVVVAVVVVVVVVMVVVIVVCPQWEHMCISCLSKQRWCV
jgi:hypothetical protein